jgi:hypothetical protein
MGRASFWAMLSKKHLVTLERTDGIETKEKG